MAVIISEWLPNPAGNDSGNEWIELQNVGSQGADISGWQIKNSSGHKFVAGSVGIPPGGFAIIKPKFAVKNSDETIFLYDASGRLIDESHFLGSAPEGNSFSRTGNTFFFTEPTPGAPNTNHLASVVAMNYDFNRPIGAYAGTTDFIGLMLGSATVVAALILFATKKNETLKNLFFPGNRETG